MSPILIRPVREQIEHDRIIRVLQARLRKEFDVEANLGDERRVPVRVGEQLFYPDLVLTAMGTSKKVQTIIEVETTESVNHLEAMAEWAHYGKARAPFHLYVPSGLVDIARRLIENYHITVAQLWSYSPVGDQVHFWLVSGNGDGILASVTDSISAAEPVRPLLPEPAPVESPRAEDTDAPAASAAAAPAARPSTPVKAAAKAKAVTKPEKAAPVEQPKSTTQAGAAAPAKAPVKAPAAPAPKPVTKPAAKPVAARSAAAKAAVKPAAGKSAQKPVAAKAPAKPAARPAAKAAAKKPVVAKPKPAARKPATPARKAASKPAARPVARKPAKATPKPAAKSRRR